MKIGGDCKNLGLSLFNQTAHPSPPANVNDSTSKEKVLRHQELQSAALLILANKQDLPGAVTAEEVARYLDLKKLDERVYMIEFVSGHDGRGIKESMDWLVEAMERSKRTEMLRSRAPAAPYLPLSSRQALLVSMFSLSIYVMMQA